MLPSRISINSTYQVIPIIRHPHTLQFPTMTDPVPPNTAAPRPTSWIEPSDTIRFSTVIEVENPTPQPPPKRPRSNLDAAATVLSKPLHQHSSNAIERLTLRTMTYLVYDSFSVTGGYKELARIAKAVAELIVDEHFPPPRRVDMSLRRKCIEFLFAPAASSLIWFMCCNLRELRTQKRGDPSPAMSRLFVVGSATWTVLHRVARQALIYRLFFRIGSLRYSLASALGIVCCFFKESLFNDFLRFARWPRHFSSTQGIAAILRSIVYATAFSLPLQRLSKRLQESPRRRGNVKKIIFALALSQSYKIMQLVKRLSIVHV